MAYEHRALIFLFLICLTKPTIKDLSQGNSLTTQTAFVMSPTHATKSAAAIQTVQLLSSTLGITTRFVLTMDT